jgi:hypothetical protein
MGVRVNAVEAVVAVALVALFPGTLSTRCSSIATTVHVRGKAFTPMMLSFQLPRLFPTSPIREILPLKKGRLLLSWAKLPMKPQVDGQLHQTVHTLGDTVFYENRIPVPTVNQALNSHVLLASNTTAGVPFKYLGITTTDSVEEQLVLTCSIIQTSSPLPLLYPLRLLCGSG